MPRPDRHAGRPRFGPMLSLEREIGDFAADVLERSQGRFVLAEFWAPWCKACTRPHPALERIAVALHGRVELVSVNIEMHPELVETQAVHALPLVKAYFKGRALGELTGVLPEPAIQYWVNSLLDAACEGGLLPPEAPAATPAERQQR